VPPSAAARGTYAEGVSPHAPQWTLRVAAALLLLSLTGCQVATGSTIPGAPSSATATATGSAPSLDELTVAKAGSMKGYSRDKFPTWRKTGANCDTRDSVLKRDGTKVKTSGCNVVAGTWKSIYDDAVLNSPTKVDIDHLVPLANAWRSGAAAWTTDKREDFANDLKDPQLVAVSASSNRSKGDQDPSTWKPKDKTEWCKYATDWVTVKTVWKLTVTAAEKSALSDMLETC
jgi:hypothetical protein